MSNINGVNNANTEYRYSTSAQTASNDSVSMQDFLMLIVAQMQNQDIFSDQDNTQFMAQMAQMASMQAMQDLTTAFMSSMSISYIGKYVKASAYTLGDKGVDLKPVEAEGYVERVNFNGGKAMVLIGETWFSVSDVYEVRDRAPDPSEKTNPDTAETNAGNNTNADKTDNTSVNP